MTKGPHRKPARVLWPALNSSGLITGGEQLQAVNFISACELWNWKRPDQRQPSHLRGLCRRGPVPQDSHMWALTPISRMPATQRFPVWQYQLEDGWQPTERVNKPFLTVPLPGPYPRESSLCQGLAKKVPEPEHAPEWGRRWRSYRAEFPSDFRPLRPREQRRWDLNYCEMQVFKSTKYDFFNPERDLKKKN